MLSQVSWPSWRGSISSTTTSLGIRPPIRASGRNVHQAVMVAGSLVAARWPLVARSLRENYVRSGDSEGGPRQRDAGRTLRAQDCSTSFHRSCGADARRHWNACQGQGSDIALDTCHLGLHRSSRVCCPQSALRRRPVRIASQRLSTGGGQAAFR